MAKEKPKLKDLPTETYTPDNAPVPVKDQLDGYIASLGKGDRKFEGLETGIKEFDELIGGLSRFVLVAGMAGVGKSTFAAQIALGVIEKEKQPVIYFSFEMAKRDMISMLLQNVSKKLFRNDLELRGNDPTLEKTKQEEIIKAFAGLKKYADKLYVLDARDEPEGEQSKIHWIEEQIEIVKAYHRTDNILVILDSVQDIVPIEANQTQAEAKTAQEIVALQHRTNATIVAIAQKNKAGVSGGGGYESVMGSVGFVHKPTTVLELTGGKEAIRRMRQDPSWKNKADEIEKIEEAFMNKTRDPENAYPVYLNVIKGRNSGYGGLSLKYYGAKRYYEVGKDGEFGEIYSMLEDAGLT